MKAAAKVDQVKDGISFPSIEREISSRFLLHSPLSLSTFLSGGNPISNIITLFLIPTAPTSLTR